MIIRVSKDKDHPYVIVNKLWVYDVRLSFKAKGVLLYLLSKPDDWNVYETEIVKHSTDGRDSVRSAIKELVKIGYITRTRTRDQYGQLRSIEYVVSESSTKNGFSNIGETNIGESNTTNIDTLNTESNKYKNDNGATLRDCTQIHSLIAYYMKELYPQYMHKKHTRLIAGQYNTVYDNINSFMDERGADYEAVKYMMEQYIQDKTLDTDYNINHFATDGIMLNKMYEYCY